MLYIHQSSCISPQQTFGNVDIEHLYTTGDNKLKVIEPAYKNIPPGVLRRMSRNVKIGIAAALPLLEHTFVDGIIIGTANGGMEESVRFLNQMVEYQEGLLTPGDFVQSTANAVASQISLMTSNKSYNSTHVHRGFSFENALLDAAMLVKENPGKNFMVGGVDVISPYNYNVDVLAGCFRKENISSDALYDGSETGTIAGEGAAMFVVNDNANNAAVRIAAFDFFHTGNTGILEERLYNFLQAHNVDIRSTLLLSGDEGDERTALLYNKAVAVCNAPVVARFKHMTGDYATASAVAVWLAAQILQAETIPQHMLRHGAWWHGCTNVLIYNAYRQWQHSIILVSKI
ncbi:beta-ketoacyl synthase chain length factor [Panacibacter sp. DH6]|uniref:Beta-ketoacyl synthase chain length factor n=1 Tax=Panacibacter microcysteis TaxID=2793269 RepID=A0A931GZZ0_9BACT|nr:beta-ketoacyl synthase chain length factor [Panacibacter microcysteis]MBG9378491.1 beta-ketoacyl synthase chain length factor [Panacibacter microcysteis]